MSSLSFPGKKLILSLSLSRKKGKFLLRRPMHFLIICLTFLRDASPGGSIKNLNFWEGEGGGGAIRQKLYAPPPQLDASQYGALLEGDIKKYSSPRLFWNEKPSRKIIFSVPKNLFVVKSYWTHCNTYWGEGRPSGRFCCSIFARIFQAFCYVSHKISFSLVYFERPNDVDNTQRMLCRIWYDISLSDV